MSITSSITNKHYNTESQEAPQQINDLPGGAFVLPGQTTGEKCIISNEICTVKNPETPYLEYVAKVVTSDDPLIKACPAYFIVGECKNGHQFAAEIYCKKEWCPICGELDSNHHKRKMSQWIPRAQSMRQMGYVVATIPKDERSKYRTKKALSLLTKKLVNGDKSKKIPGYLKARGYDHGFMRWHYFSEEQPGVYNPHLNILLEAGKISKHELKMFKKAWANILGVPVAVLHYQYTNEPQKMMHLIKYVTRSTFKERYWDHELADELYGFHNMRTFGKWTGELAWEIEGEKAEKSQAAQKLGEGICPICGEKVTWREVKDIMWLRIWEAAGWVEPYEEGYYRIGGGESGENGGHS